LRGGNVKETPVALHVDGIALTMAENTGPPCVVNTGDLIGESFLGVVSEFLNPLFYPAHARSIPILGLEGHRHSGVFFGLKTDVELHTPVSLNDASKRPSIPFQ